LGKEELEPGNRLLLGVARSFHCAAGGLSPRWADSRR